MDIDACIDAVKSCKYLPEKQMQQLCNKVKDILAEESTVVPVHSPVTLCGDIHGQFYDLLKLFEVGGPIPSTSYIFMVSGIKKKKNGKETQRVTPCLSVGWLCGSRKVFFGNTDVTSFVQGQVSKKK